MGGMWIIPEMVSEEVEPKRSMNLLMAKIELNAHVSRVEIVDVNPLVRSWDLGAGESAVLTVALQNCDAHTVLDDLQARKAAKSLDVPLVGTLGLIVRAYKAGYVDSVEVAVQRVMDAGLYVGQEVINRVLRAANNGDRSL